MSASIEGFRDALGGPAVRVEFAPTLNLTAGGMVETARVYTRAPGSTRWTKVDPLLLPREGGDRADLLDDLARILRGQA